jgi:hypothetical protein
VFLIRFFYGKISNFSTIPVFSPKNKDRVKKYVVATVDRRMEIPGPVEYDNLEASVKISLLPLPSYCRGFSRRICHYYTIDK